MKKYLLVREALECCLEDRKKSREFGISNKELCQSNSRLNLIIKWAKSRIAINIDKKGKESFSRYLSRIEFISYIIFFILGLLLSASLLTYSGSEPVNVVYLLLFYILFPILSIVVSLLSIIEIILSKNSLIADIMPPYWLLKIFKTDKIKSYTIPATLFKTYIIYKAQIISAIFYIGAFISFIVIIATQDIAFAWSSTLSISTDELHRFVEYIAIPWREYLPQAVPSMKLIEFSHFYHIDGLYALNAQIVGEWWRFLAMSIIFYAILPRIIIFPFIYLYHKKIEKDTILSDKRVVKLIRNICEPIIEKSAVGEEKSLKYEHKEYQKVQKSRVYDSIALWSIDIESAEEILRHYDISADTIIEFGGNKRYDLDLNDTKRLKGAVLVIVKSWEPPTMDFIDILIEIQKSVDEIYILPIGLRGYTPKESDIDIWIGKIKYCGIDDIKVVK